MANLPEPRYGAAAIALIEKRLFPSWALFVYSDLKSRAGDALPPELLCLQCEDALILAPNIGDGVMIGMLIASESASNSIRTLKSPCGLTVEARIPAISSKYEATEDVEINILRIIKNHD